MMGTWLLLLLIETGGGNGAYQYDLYQQTYNTQDECLFVASALSQLEEVVAFCQPTNEEI